MSPGNPIILGLKVKVMSHKNIAGVGLCTVVSAGFFWIVKPLTLPFLLWLSYLFPLRGWLLHSSYVCVCVMCNSARGIHWDENKERVQRWCGCRHRLCQLCTDSQSCYQSAQRGMDRLFIVTKCFNVFILLFQSLKTRIRKYQLTGHFPYELLLPDAIFDALPFRVVTPFTHWMTWLLKEGPLLPLYSFQAPVVPTEKIFSRKKFVLVISCGFCIMEPGITCSEYGKHASWTRIPTLPGMSWNF